MTTRESELARRITRYLDRGAAELRAGTAYRLQQIRAEALARLADPQTERAPGTELARDFAGRGSAGDGRRAWPLRWWLGLALFVGVAWLGWQQWQAFEQVKEFEEIDAQILSSDLPIDAYTDRGFQNWLRASFER